MYATHRREVYLNCWREVQSFLLLFLYQQQSLEEKKERRREVDQGKSQKLQQAYEDG